MKLQQIRDKIYEVRGRRVMLDFDLARLYGVETRRLNETVTRNAGRFPEGAMFRLTADELAGLRSQIVTSTRSALRKLPCAYTEQGIMVLSDLLNKEKVIEVDIAVMRALVHLRESAMTPSEIMQHASERIDLRPFGR